ncbi:hypothetical protein ACN47E_006098 [Coniothyrium glycines]
MHFIINYTTTVFVTRLIHLTVAKSLFSTSPADANDIIRTTYPLGNGRLGVMPFGPAGAEKLVINLDTLWSGGPFEAANYTGGNPQKPAAPALSGIREWIFTDGTGNVTELLGYDGDYGSYRVLGNLSVTIPSLLVNNTKPLNYTRTLNLRNGIHTTRFWQDGVRFDSQVFCSYPDQVCVYRLETSTQLPSIHLSLNNDLADQRVQNSSCSRSDALQSPRVRLQGQTQLGPPEGMRYNAIVQMTAGTSALVSCSDVGVLSLTPQNGTSVVTMVVGAGTNFDAKRGSREQGYSFQGEDPGSAVEETVQAAAKKTFEQLLDTHIQDFGEYTSRFELSLPDTQDSAQLPTALIIARYKASETQGDPYLESLLFEYATYLFVSSSRPDSLPPNLQGRWSEGLGAAWSGDYHANINLQMNHWTPDQTGLTELQSPLWDYITDNWIPRGSETAELIYGAPGWVVHNEMNIFGHTGMKSGASWANYPAAAAWMMQHIFDHWDYSRDTEWLRRQGYPILEGVARFWLSQLQTDEFTKDNSLVVNPCNSPEHGPTTFGCAHYQQLIHQVFEAVLTLEPVVGATDESFVKNVSLSLNQLDKGFHIGDWGQIKEWKLPDFYGYDYMNDTHRHLSELVGWHPGYSLSSFMGGYANKTIQDAITQKLYSRGEGNGPDANAGWAKVWRSACWARLNNTERAHFELRYAIEQNFAENGLSMYSASRTPFQIDANFGLGGAILSMLIVDLPSAVGDNAIRTVVLGPAITAAWANGEVRGLRLRGGGAVNFAWDQFGVVKRAQLQDRTAPLRVVDKHGVLLTQI